MANFNTSYNRTAANEGGYQNSANDPGNYNSAGQRVGTNWGINAKVYGAWIGHPPSVAEMQAMTKATAKAIMKANYWDKIWGDDLPNQYVADILFDGVVNHGKGVRLAQEVLGVAADNIFGQQTYNALVAMQPAKFYNAYRERRRSYYFELVSASPGLAEFLDGWLARLSKYNDFGSGGGTSRAGFGWLGAAFLLYLGYSNRKTLFR